MLPTAQGSNSGSKPETQIQSKSSLLQKHRYSPWWIVFWLIIAAGTIGTGLILDNFVSFTIVQYQNLGLGLMLGCIGSFFFSMKLIPGGYSISKQAICHMGRMKTKKGDNNRWGAFFFALFAALEAVLILLLGNLVFKYRILTNHLNVVPYLCYFSAVFAMLTGTVPIDVAESKHLLSAFLLYSAANIFINYLFIFFIQVAWTSLAIYVVMIFVDITGIGYIWGYLTNYRYAATFQKLWIVGITIAFQLYIGYFAAIVVL